MKDNLRKCIGCMNNFDRNSMFRILKHYQTNELILSPTNKDFGRSVYICKNKECVKNAFRKGKISRILKNTSLDWLEELLKKEVSN